MIPARTLALLIVSPIMAGAAHADTARPPALKQGTIVPVSAYGRQNPHCAEWTNGCVVCVSANGHPQCSTPGIACTPAGLTCKRQATP